MLEPTLEEFEKAALAKAEAARILEYLKNRVGFGPEDEIVKLKLSRSRVVLVMAILYEVLDDTEEKNE